jgi:uncharacterized DUF497 family protein
MGRDQSWTSRSAQSGSARSGRRAVLDKNAVLLELQFEAGEERTKVLGMTASGRVLAVVFTLRGDVIRPITAYTAPRRLQKLYIERRGE